MPLILQVAIGGALGAVCRYLMGLASLRAFGPAFPYGTLAVNVLGSFVMGIAFVVITQRVGTPVGRLAPFVMTGILGGFTTFSAFSLDALILFEKDRLMAAGLYVVGTVLMSFVAIAIGVMVGKSVMA